LPVASPPQGAPWDLPLAEAPLAFLDLEMTGLEATKDRVVEVCLERVRGGVVEARLETLVDPGEAAGGNAHIHGLGAAELAGAPTFASLVPRLRALLDGAVIVAHASKWDVGFLEAEFARAGVAVELPFHLDTLTLSRRAFSEKSHALGALAARFGITQESAHRAGDDVRVLRAVFAKIAAALEAKTPRDLWHVRVGERKARPEIVAACEVARESGRPVRLTFRQPGRGALERDAVITAVRTDLDPPRVMGYSLPSRGRFELRADRILAVHAGP
jgi:DNA polymerase-3 subunit epsilon